MPVTLLTGASSGIGRSLARRIAVEGHAVALLARRAPLLETLAEEIRVAGGTALALPCDVTSLEEVMLAFRTAEQTLGAIDRVVANAGGGERTDAAAFTSDHLSRVMTLNLMGTAHVIEATLPGMIERRRGHIIAMGSIASYRGLPGAAAYCAAKAAVSSLMESLRIDLKPHGIDVTLLLPGFVRTDATKKKKKRPFELDLETATSRLHKAIRARAPRYATPWPLATLMAAGWLMPAGLYDQLLAGKNRGKKATKPGSG